MIYYLHTILFSLLAIHFVYLVLKEQHLLYSSAFDELFYSVFGVDQYYFNSKLSINMNFRL